MESMDGKPRNCFRPNLARLMQLWCGTLTLVRWAWVLATVEVIEQERHEIGCSTVCFDCCVVCSKCSRSKGLLIQGHAKYSPVAIVLVRPHPWLRQTCVNCSNDN